MSGGPLDTSLSPVPDNSADARIAELSSRLAALERGGAPSFAVTGSRTDLGTDALGVRARIGLLPDGTYGYEVFTEDGKRCRNGHWAGEVFFFAGATVPQGCEEAAGGSVDGTTSDEKYLYLWKAIGTTHGGSGQSSFTKPNARGRVLVGKATSGTFVALGGTGGAETDSVSVSVSGSVSGTITTTPTMTSTGDNNNFNAAADGTYSLSGGSFSGSGGDTVSTLQPYIILLACLAL